MSLAPSLEANEGTQDHVLAVPVPAESLNTASPLRSQTIAPPSIRQDFAGSLATVATARGKATHIAGSFATAAAGQGGASSEPSALRSKWMRTGLREIALAGRLEPRRQAQGPEPVLERSEPKPASVPRSFFGVHG
jgi:hypothetical protein